MSEQTTNEAEEEKLTLKQERFCELYATDREFFGNGTQAYIEAYDINLSKPGAYQSAMAAASRLLRNVKILARIDEHLEALNLNDQHVDKQLGFWLTQKASPQAAVAAIKEYNALKKRITKQLEVHDFRETREKIGGFLDDTTDIDDDDGGAASVEAVTEPSGGEVAQPTADIS